MSSKLSVLGLLIAISAANAQKIYWFDVSPTGEQSRADITWASYPFSKYDVKTVGCLGSNWTSIAGGGVTASNLSHSISHISSNLTRFFLVQEIDTSPPEITFVYPRHNSFAVPRYSSITVGLTDPSGIDTNAVAMTVNGFPYSLSSSNLTYDSGALAYEPLGTALGPFGGTVTVAVAASDLLGHSASNTASFSLEREDVPRSGLRGFSTQQPATEHARADASDIWVEQVLINRVIFGYSGEPSLCVGDACYPTDGTGMWYRLITACSTNETNHTLTAYTDELRLTDIMENGSFCSLDFVEVVPDGSGGIQPNVEFGGGLRFDIPEQQFGNFEAANESDDVQISGSIGSWALSSGIEVSGVIEYFTLKQFEATADGTVYIALDPEITVQLQGLAEGEKQLVKYTKNFAASYVWIVLEFTIDVDAMVDAKATGSIGLEEPAVVGKALQVRVYFDGNEWTSEPDEQDWNPESVELQWQIEGQVDAQVSLTPKLAIYVCNLVGVSGSVQPRIDFTGRYRANPLAWTNELRAALDVAVGLELRFWDEEEWGDLPQAAATVFEKQLWLDTYPDGPPEITQYPEDVICSEGETVSFQVEAEGEAPLSYQWYQDGVPCEVPGSDTDTLRFPASEQCEGTYTVWVANDHGWREASATLVVAGGDPPTEGLVAYYPLDGDAGDESGNGNNGTADAGVSWPENSYASFSGAGGINISEVTSLLRAAPFTVTAWVRVAGGGDQYQHVVSTDERIDDSFRGVILQYGRVENALMFGLGTGGPLYRVLLFTLPAPNTWYHIAGTYDGSTQVFYVNGSPVGTDTGGWQPSSLPPRIGVNARKDGDHLSGGVDEVRIYRKVLTQPEIQATMYR